MLFSYILLERINEVKRTFSIDLRNLGVVKENLKFVYTACVASEDLLIDAAECLDWHEQDLFGATLIDYYRSHLEEERDEINLLADDLKFAGITLDFQDEIAMAMVGTQYYLIKHVHPVSLLGYMAVTEADPVPLPVVEVLEKLYGEKMFRFLRLHAIKDLEHRKELIEIMDMAPECLCDLISSSTENTLGYFKKAASTWQTKITQ